MRIRKTDPEKLQHDAGELDRAERRQHQADALAHIARVALEDGDSQTAHRAASQIRHAPIAEDQRHRLLARLDFTKACCDQRRRSAAEARDRAAGTLDGLFALAVCLLARGKYVQALEHLFLVVERDPDYRAGAAQTAVSRVLHLLGERNRLAASYWTRLGRACHRRRSTHPSPREGT
jgi:thioredoxin-like negative regulator of GroEL